MDVGSTTVKAVAVDQRSDEILWQDYQRHETKLGEKVFEFLERMEKDLGVSESNSRIFFTGSGGSIMRIVRIMPEKEKISKRSQPYLE